MESAIYDKSGPFGDADASRVDFNKLKNSFINLTSMESNGLDETIDTSVRVIVGRKGSGKTLYLRSIQDHYRRLNSDNDNTVYITDIDNTPPETSLIVKITAWYQDEEKINKSDEIWRLIWRCVLLRTAFCHACYSSDLQKYMSARQRAALSMRYEKILPRLKVPTSIFNQLKSILVAFNSPKDLENYLFMDEWGGFEYEMNQILKNLPPMYFFLDQLDDDFAHAPYHWLKCQYGLFSAMFRFIRSNTLGGRLHVIACIRELVYAYVLNSQQGSKYLSEAKIKVLRWDYNLAKHFIEKKIEYLDDRYFKQPDIKSIENFFGMKELKLSRNGGHLERIHSYILRHTLLMPRDIINIGNIYAEKFATANSSYNSENALKDAVRCVAKQIAKEQMTVAAILISTRWIYNGAVENDSLNVFTDQTMLNSIHVNLCNLVIAIGKDRFSREELDDAASKLIEMGFNEHDDPFNALFLSGLIGFTECSSDIEKTCKDVFFSESRNTQYHLPNYKTQYVFHSSLIDFLDIQPIGEPVYA